MSDILDTMYEGYCEQVYTLSETLAAFAQRKVFAEDCEGKYDSAFLRFLPRRSGKTLPFRQKMLNKPSVYVRPSSQKDRVSLESFSVQFQEELYDDEEKEDFLDLDSLVLVQSLEEESLQGALWWEILGERNELHKKTLGMDFVIGDDFSACVRQTCFCAGRHAAVAGS